MTPALFQRPPTPKGLPVVGLLPEFRRNPALFLQRMAKEYGDVVFLRVARQKIYLLNHPDFVREVLVTEQHKFKKSRMLERAKVLLGEGLLTNEGASHRRQRRLVQPAFHRDRLVGYGNTMIERACVARERWHRGDTVDVSQEMMRLTMDIVSRTLFSAQVEGEADEIGEALGQVFGLFDVILLPFSEYLEKLPLPSMLRFRTARKRLDETIYRLIAERRASGEDKGDLLSMLLLAQDEDDAGGMSDTQVRDEVLTLFLAGHETTANALTWAWYLLSQNPEAEARLHAELDEVLAGRVPTVEDAGALRYASGVVQESLRLYPPAWAIGRRALEDVSIGGYTVPKGDIVLMSPYVMHRDARWFPEPERFKPERWLTEDPARPKFAYFPFGGGARVCIGERFAWMEGVLLLAVIAQKWKLSLVPGHAVEIRPQITLRPKNGMRMTLAERA
ncbi:MAG: cytochrome P450 [Acidobacteriota bacterium]